VHIHPFVLLSVTFITPSIHRPHLPHTHAFTDRHGRRLAACVHCLQGGSAGTSDPHVVAMWNVSTTAARQGDSHTHIRHLTQTGTKEDTTRRGMRVALVSMPRQCVSLGCKCPAQETSENPTWRRAHTSEQAHRAAGRQATDTEQRLQVSIHYTHTHTHTHRAPAATKNCFPMRHPSCAKTAVCLSVCCLSVCLFLHPAGTIPPSHPPCSVHFTRMLHTGHTHTMGKALPTAWRVHTASIQIHLQWQPYIQISTRIHT